MKKRVKSRNVSANRGFARGGSAQKYRERVRTTLSIGGVLMWALVGVLISAAILAATFGVRRLLNKGEQPPRRVTVVYSPDVSVKYDREDIYIGGVLYLDFDVLSAVFELSKSVSAEETGFYTKNGDSLLFVTDTDSVKVNGIICPAGGRVFLNEKNALMVPAFVVNAYMNDTEISVSKDNKTVTVVSVSDGMSFSPKKSDALSGMGRPSSFPADTKYDPDGTLPPDEITLPPQMTTESVGGSEADGTTGPSIYPSDAEVLGLISGYTFKTDITEYKAYMNPKNYEPLLVLANRENPLGKDYVPSQVWKFPEKYTLDGKELYLKDNAYMALCAMIEEMIAEGVWDTSVCSGYRSYDYQYGLYYDRYYNQEKAKNPSLSDEEIFKIIDTYSARPGTSDHQTGLCVDFYELEETFENRKAFKWLEQNAYKFGFILRFPKGKTDITGYTYEPWHWRFVGQVAAYKIHSAGITLEEFLASRH